MINYLRDFKYERNQMDNVIAEERRSMFNTQQDMSKQIYKIDETVDGIQ
jgi:hypothetical protein